MAPAFLMQGGLAVGHQGSKLFPGKSMMLMGAFLPPHLPLFSDSDTPSHFVLPLSARKSILCPSRLRMGLFLCVGCVFFVTPKTVFVQIQACKLMISELLIASGFPVCPISYHPMSSTPTCVFPLLKASAVTPAFCFRLGLRAPGHL